MQFGQNYIQEAGRYRRESEIRRRLSEPPHIFYRAMLIVSRPVLKGPLHIVTNTLMKMMFILLKDSIVQSIIEKPLVPTNL